MPFAIIADWDAQFRVSRYNYVDTELNAIALVDRLQNGTAYPEHGFPDLLPLAKQAPNAYYVLMPPAPAGTALFQHRARFWVADPGTGTVSFDTVACHAWQSKGTSRGIDTEADRRIDRVFSPDDPSRAGRIREELSAGPVKTAFMVKVTALRTAAQTLKDSLAAKTPEEVLAVHPDDNIHWPE